MAPLADDRRRDRLVLDRRFEPSLRWSDEDLEHPQWRVRGECLLGVPDPLTRPHHQEALGVNDHLVALAVLVAHHTAGHPGDDLLVAVLVHPDQCAWVEKRLDDRRQRPVAVVLVVGHRPPGEVEVDAKLPLIL